MTPVVAHGVVFVATDRLYAFGPSVQATATTVAGSFVARATAPGAAGPVFFRLTNVAGAPAKVTAAAASTPQSAPITTPYPEPLRATVTDAAGNPVLGVVVTFTAPAAEPTGVFPETPPRTDAYGDAIVSGIAGSVGGSYVDDATTPGVAAPASFALTNTNAAPGSVWILSGSGQSTPVSTTFPAPVVVEVRDMTGKFAPGVTVTLTMPSTGPSATTTSPLVTDSSGRISVTLLANDRPGPFDATFSVPGAGAPAVASLTILPIQTTNPGADGGVPSGADGGMGPAALDDGTLEGGGIGCSASPSTPASAAGTVLIAFGLVALGGVERRRRRR